VSVDAGGELDVSDGDRCVEVDFDGLRLIAFGPAAA
jgi:hypothetical protein